MSKLASLSLALILSAGNFVSSAQQGDDIITVASTSRIEKTLSSDEMQGRRSFTPALEKAADFIAAEFKAAGLSPLKGQENYRQTFYMYSATPGSLNGSINGKAVPASDWVLVSTNETVQATEKDGYEIKSVSAGENLFRAAFGLISEKKNYLVQVDESFRNNFSRLTRMASNMFPSDKNVIFVLSKEPVKSFEIKAAQSVEKKPLSNVAGMIPGKTKPDEFVIFSGHYDHLGIGKPENGDSIYNGANDDAAGTTAVIQLARYYAAQPAPARSLIFVAFAAEEMGGFGSQYFSRQMDPDKVVAMLNIEMIGTDSKWGNNSAYITGYEKSDLGKILQENLKGSKFEFHPDPYPEQQLFYRSDNATLARLGVPAHTISTSKMDSEPHYHKASDEFETLDMENMTEIIRAIAHSARSLVEGKATPTRVDRSTLLR